MKAHTVTVVFRSLLGFIFVIGPLGSALHLSAEPALPPSGAAFAAALKQTGYMLPLIWTTEIAAGGLLLLGELVPFALLLLAPVTVNIVAFHLFLAPDGLVISVLLVVFEMVLAWQYHRVFRGLFAPSTRHQEAGAPAAIGARAA